MKHTSRTDYITKGMAQTVIEKPRRAADQARVLMAWRNRLENRKARANINT